jgi:hypothetical protein
MDRVTAGGGAVSRQDYSHFVMKQNSSSPGLRAGGQVGVALTPPNVNPK